MRHYFASLILLFLIFPQTALANLPNQMNVNAGLDMPSDGGGGSAGLLRFQLQTPPKVFRFQTAFTLAVGSGKKMGEFSGGFALYPMNKALENTKIEPFLGAEGIAGLGAVDEKNKMVGGYSLFTGVDLKIFDKKSGLTLSVGYTRVDEPSLRFWLGLFFLKI